LRKYYPPAARYRFGDESDMSRLEWGEQMARRDAALKRAAEILGVDRFRRFEEGWVQARGISGVYSPGTPVLDRLKLGKEQVSDFLMLAARSSKESGIRASDWLVAKADEVLTEEQRALYRRLQGAPLAPRILNELKIMMHSPLNADEFLIPLLALGAEQDPARKR
jgi:hypothetical protein